jgi:hypothetical protein
MESENNIEILIEKIRLLMPSSGSWPVTVISTNRAALKGLSFEPNILAEHQLLFLIRTDFNMNDLVDYISNTVEFLSIPIANKANHLNFLTQKINNKSDLSNWWGEIASLSIGLAIGLSENLDLCIEPIEANLKELDNYFQFNNRNLKAHQLFEIYTCHC